MTGPQHPPIGDSRLGRPVLQIAGVLLLIAGVFIREGWPLLVAGFLILIGVSRAQ